MVRIKLDKGWQEVLKSGFGMLVLCLIALVSGLLITDIFFTDPSSPGRNTRILAMLLVGSAQIINLSSIRLRKKQELYNENVETIESEYGIKFTDEQKYVKEKKGQMGIIPPEGETFTFTGVKSAYIPEDPNEKRYEYAEAKLRRDSANSVTLFTPITSMYRQDEKDPEGFMKGYLRNY